MRKWIKYIAVVCCFLIMAGIFVPDSGGKVNASEAGTVSENGVTPVSTGEEGTIEEGAAPASDNTEGWTVTYEFELGGITDAVWEYSEGNSIETSGELTSGGTIRISIVGIKPTATEHTFSHWLCTVTGVEDTNTISGTEYPITEGNTINIDLEQEQYAGATIIFTAQWTEVTKTPTNGEVSSGSGTYLFNEVGEYTLGDGTWTVDGDSSTYPGGIKFYVGTPGTTYKFTHQN